MFKNKKIIEYFLSAFIMFISTAVIPNLFISILQVSWNVAVLAAFASTITLAILIIIRHLLHRIFFLERQREDLSGDYEELMVYSINGRAWADVVGRNTCRVTRCTLFIRRYIEGLGERNRYESEMHEAIALWKSFKQSGRIAQLYIYEYDHISDHFYAIFDNSLVVTGLNHFDSSDSTGQYGDRRPHQIHADSPENIELIQKYKADFKNKLEYYKDKIIYDSTQQ